MATVAAEVKTGSEVTPFQSSQWIYRSVQHIVVKEKGKRYSEGDPYLRQCDALPKSKMDLLVETSLCGQDVFICGSKRVVNARLRFADLLVRTISHDHKRRKRETEAP